MQQNYAEAIVFESLNKGAREGDKADGWALTLLETRCLFEVRRFLSEEPAQRDRLALTVLQTLYLSSLRGAF
ncbi:hypothetical protein [Runella sp.]|uniref:hypothetical protein n=1 Tax=Runella sp. TaxID=1960881 RepID=UPI003D0ABEF5